MYVDELDNSSDVLTSRFIVQYVLTAARVRKTSLFTISVTGSVTVVIGSVKQKEKQRNFTFLILK